MTHKVTKCNFCLCMTCTHFSEGCPDKRPCLRGCDKTGPVRHCELYAEDKELNWGKHSSKVPSTEKVCLA